MQMRDSRQARINVTPYIDILLVLLIIFMVIQPTARFELRARTHSESGLRWNSAPALVEIDRSGALHLNGRPLSFAMLGEALFEFFKGRSRTNLFVSAPEDVPFGLVAGVIDIAKGAGAGDVGLLDSGRFGKPELAR